MAFPTLNGITLNNVDSISVDKNANIIPLPMPSQDSSSTELFDAFGVTKTITVRGTWAADTTTVKGYVDSFEALVSGNQSSVSFVSDQTGTISVMLLSIATSWEIPGVVCTFDIKLIQGSG